LTELIQGRTLQEVIVLPKEMLLTALHTTIRPARMKCALLSLHVLQAGIATYLVSCCAPTQPSSRREPS